MYLLLLVIVLIVHGSLYPWHFDFERGLTNPFLAVLRSWPQQWNGNTFQDAILNVLLYCPLGAAAFRLSARKYTPPEAAGSALLLGLTLSAVLELIQVYVPSRTGSIGDILFNFCGAVLGIVFAWRFRQRLETSIELLSRRRPTSFGSPAAWLLACWAGYQLYPFVPQFRPGSLPAEIQFLLNPGQPDRNSPYPAEILSAAVEWYVAILIAQSLFGRIRPRWVIWAIGFRLAVRPFLLTRLFALDELIGAALALSIWFVLGGKIRRVLGLVMLAFAIALRQLACVHFSQLPHDYSPTGEILRKSFDFGALGFLLWVQCRFARIRPPNHALNS